MPTTSAEEPFTLHLPAADRAELYALARATSRDPSALAAEAVATYLDAQRWSADLIRRRMKSGPEGIATEEEVTEAYAFD